MHHVQSVLLDIIQSLLIFLFTALLKDIIVAFSFDYTRKGIKIDIHHIFYWDFSYYDYELNCINLIEVLCLNEEKFNHKIA